MHSELATTFVFFSGEINNLKIINVSRFCSGPLVARRDSNHFRCGFEQAFAVKASLKSVPYSELEWW